MNFQEAVQKCFINYVGFTGRAGRSEYWYWVLFVVVGSLVLAYVDQSLSSIFSLIVMLPWFAVATRRLRDVGRSGWWMLLVLTGIGYFVLLYWMVQPSEGPNQFGAAP